MIGKMAFTVCARCATRRTAEGSKKKTPRRRTTVPHEHTVKVKTRRKEHYGHWRTQLV